MKSQIENLGKVAPTFEGAYNNELEYNRLSCVFDENTCSTYISRRPVPIGIPIDDMTYWQPLSIGTNRIPLTEQLGEDSFRAVTQKFITKLWNEQYAFNDTVKDAVDIAERTFEAIGLLSPDQQEALALATSIVDCIRRLEIIENNLNGYAFEERTEDQYEQDKNDNILKENTLYFVYEKQDEEEPDDFE